VNELVIAKRYARALYKVAAGRDAEELALVALGAFADAFREHEELRRFLLHPAVPREAKEQLVAKLVDDELTRDFLTLLIKKDRLELVPVMDREFDALYRRYAGVLAAELTTAEPVDDKFREELKGVLRGLTGKRVELTAHVDEKVIGGARLVVGDRVIDGTLAKRLESIKAAMATAGV
jgi:F-type H+-transporting ATPase subunit delta